MEKRIETVWQGWKVVKKIGVGGFGAVYEINRDVFGKIEKAALKVISVPQNSNEVDELYDEGYNIESITRHFKGQMEDIVKEYSLMVDMKGHPNVVYCDDLRYVEHEDGIGWDIFIKMELLTPLTKIVGSGLSKAEVVKLGTDISAALSACKKHNIIHRDIKPQNIFVSRDGFYKLGDFGIAKISEKTQSGTKIGTFEYMPPEVFAGKPYGATADIYSLGLVLYWLLNEHRMPFITTVGDIPTANEKIAARTRRLNGEALPAPKNGSDELKAVVLKACAFNPADRYATPDEFLAALNAVNTGMAAVPVIGADVPDDDEKTLSVLSGVAAQGINADEDKTVIQPVAEEKTVAQPIDEDKTVAETKTELIPDLVTAKPNPAPAAVPEPKLVPEPTAEITESIEKNVADISLHTIKRKLPVVSKVLLSIFDVLTLYLMLYSYSIPHILNMMGKSSFYDFFGVNSYQNRFFIYRRGWPFSIIAVLVAIVLIGAAVVRIYARFKEIENRLTKAVSVLFKISYFMCTVWVVSDGSAFEYIIECINGRDSNLWAHFVFIVFVFVFLIFGNRKTLSNYLFAGSLYLIARAYLFGPMHDMLYFIKRSTNGLFHDLILNFMKGLQTLFAAKDYGNYDLFIHDSGHFAVMWAVVGLIVLIALVALFLLMKKQVVKANYARSGVIVFAVITAIASLITANHHLHAFGGYKSFYAEFMDFMQDANPLHFFWIAIVVAAVIRFTINKIKAQRS